MILSDIDALYTADPRRDSTAQRIVEVAQIDQSVYDLAGGSHTRGTGGMLTKIQAADLATRSGIGVVITAGSAPDVLLRILAGEALGTRFKPVASKLESRKRWLLAETVRNSRIMTDAGAARALRESGRSLLPAGIIAIEGAFERGQTVRIYTQEGQEIARGLAQYSSRDVQLIKGCLLYTSRCV